VFKYLDISTRQVYVSWDVVFVKSVFPFAQLHPNDGVRYTSGVLLLLDVTLRASTDLSLDNIHTNTCLSLSTLWSYELLQPQMIPTPSSAAPSSGIDPRADLAHDSAAPTS
jgi:hypothetical protein